ncbi:MAG TPA: type II toxin-antitoxin system VapC family toxin [Propionibacteriaceae bacterium]|nr:type II toxin-antitoxin system VapC family toxin [Propionibacteriaceae bacterium]
MIYLDSSALLKLLVEERESAALAEWISERSATPKVSSELAKLEVVRAARRLDSRVVPPARAVVSQLDLIPWSSSLIEEAADAGDPTLRSLDAIHLVSALSIREALTAFVAYDPRLIGAAQAAGLTAESPS